MAQKQHIVRGRKRKSENLSNVRAIEYRKADKGPGIISTKHFKPARPAAGGGRMGMGYMGPPPSEEEVHPDAAAAGQHLMSNMGGAPAAAPGGPQMAEAAPAPGGEAEPDGDE